MSTQPTVKNIEKWVVALRSGEYKQGQCALQNTIGYCCLGVACDIFIPKNKQQKQYGRILGGVPEDQPLAPKWLKQVNMQIEHLTKKSLSHLNDSGIVTYLEMSHFEKLDPLTFDEIADVLEAVYILKVLK